MHVLKYTLKILIIFYKMEGKNYSKTAKFGGQCKDFVFLEDISKSTIFGALALSTVCRETVLGAPEDSLASQQMKSLTLKKGRKTEIKKNEKLKKGKGPNKIS